MADAPESDRPTATQETGAKSSSIFDSEIGDDWGEAFEADDFMLSSDEDTSSEFFLEEDEFEDSVKPQEKSDPEEGSQSSGKKFAIELPSYVYVLFNRIKSTANRSKERFLSLPLLYRIPLVAVSFVVLLSTYYFTKMPPPEPAVQHVPIQTAMPIQAPLSSERNADVAPRITTEAPEEKMRKKWHFPSFLISTSDEMKGDNIFFVEIDITFILLLREDEKIPTDKSVFVRDIIYQFFNNRPLYELRRYSLARGEMNRKLRSWVEKQWPEGEIASIVFNRYLVR